MLLFELPSILAIIAATFLAYTGKEGWGWCLVVAVLLSTSTVKRTVKNKPNDPERSA